MQLLKHLHASNNAFTKVLVQHRLMLMCDQQRYLIMSTVTADYHCSKFPLLYFSSNFAFTKLIFVFLLKYALRPF